jgi:hypothetical protein
MAEFEWTGLGCDVCGFGSVENVEEFDPRKPCPECKTIAIPPTEASEANDQAAVFLDDMLQRGAVKDPTNAFHYHLARLLRKQWRRLCNVECGNCGTKGTLAPLVLASSDSPSPPKEGASDK